MTKELYIFSHLSSVLTTVLEEKKQSTNAFIATMKVPWLDLVEENPLSELLQKET